MERNQIFATRLPASLKRQLTAICALLGVRKNFVVEEAIREKLEDLLDAYDLRQSVREASGFHSWDSIKKEIK